MTKKPITLLLDVEIIKKLRAIQAKQLTKGTRSISLSLVLNETLKQALKK